MAMTMGDIDRRAGLRASTIRRLMAHEEIKELETTSDTVATLKNLGRREIVGLGLAECLIPAGADATQE